MDSKYEISFSVSTNSLETITIYVDNIKLDSKSNEYIWKGSKGIHQIRIEQDKMFKSKWYWINAPLFFLFGMLGSEIIFDGKTPYYYYYEAETYINKNMKIYISLSDINKCKEKSKQDMIYDINVIYPEDTIVNVIRSELTASPKEKIKWFLGISLPMTLLFAFILFICFSSIKDLSFSSIFLLGVAVLLIIGWVIIIYKMYKNTNISNII